MLLSEELVPASKEPRLPCEDFQQDLRNYGFCCLCRHSKRAHAIQEAQGELREAIDSGDIAELKVAISNYEDAGATNDEIYVEAHAALEAATQIAVGDRVRCMQFGRVGKVVHVAPKDFLMVSFHNGVTRKVHKKTVVIVSKITR